MSTQYIDVNAVNSSVIDANFNNRFEYRLNEGMELPTGTSISVQSSFINKKGITGGSIEIEEDIIEELHFNYYGVDTDYQTLVQEPQDPAHITNFNLYVKYSDPQNQDDARRVYDNVIDPLTTGNITSRPFGVQNGKVGRTESVMPLVNFVKSTDGIICVPMIGVIKIKVPKGTYSVQSLASLIEDQLNGTKILSGFYGDNDTNFIELQKSLGINAGIPVNNVCNTLIKAEEPYVAPKNGTNYNTSFPTNPTTGPLEATPYWSALHFFNDSVPKDPPTSGKPSDASFNANNTLFTDQLSFKDVLTAPDGTKEWVSPLRPLTATDGIKMSAIMITPKHYDSIRQGFVNATDAQLRSSEFQCLPMYSHFKNTSSANNDFGFNDSTNKLYYQGFSAMRNQAEFNADPNNFISPAAGISNYGVLTDDIHFQKIATPLFCNTRINFFDVGVPVGALTQISIDYDTDVSSFELSRLHTPRRFPSHDKYGNSLKAQQGQEGIYFKRYPTGNFLRTDVFHDIYTKNDAAVANDVAGVQELLTDGPIIGETYRELNSCLQNIMSKTTGIQIYNWAFKTAKRLGTKVLSNTQTDTIRNFDEFFNSEEEARLAFKETLWGRIGFTYDQLQKPSNWGNSKMYYQDQPNSGFTTGADVDSSVITSISTLFNSFNAGTSSDSDRGRPLPTLSNVGIQLYENLDVNVPANPFNNNAHGVEPQDVVFSPYQGSFYSHAVMIPVITTPKKTISDNLPTLSKDGYFIVSSNIIGDNDIAKKADPVPILDVVPLTSLNNQDFIVDRTEITHTLSNPKVINSINISILKPDLTNPVLEPNSSVLLKITKPLPKSTEVRAEAIIDDVEKGIQSEVDKELQQSITQSQPKK